jgi:acyl-CoA thioesterase I
MPSRRQVPQQPLTPNRRTALAALVATLAWPLFGCRQSPTQAAIPSGATVLAFGDSITHGTGAAQGEDWPTFLAARTGWNLVNAGIPGDTAQGGRARIASLLSQHQPALVIVGLGGNDFLRRRAADQVNLDGAVGQRAEGRPHPPQRRRLSTHG